MLLKHMLAEWGYEVVVTRSGMTGRSGNGSKNTLPNTWMPNSATACVPNTWKNIIRISMSKQDLVVARSVSAYLFS